MFNDWEAACHLVDELDRVFQARLEEVSIVLVDDGSTDVPPSRLEGSPTSIEAVTLLKLRRNLGHQRAIAIGLCHIHSNEACQEVVVMDADGEDAPADVLPLLDRCRANQSKAVVFARRKRRSEGWLFRSGYVAFRTMHYLLTGRSVEIGNFSAIPANVLGRVVGVSEIWSHYAAGVVHAGLPVDKVPLDRAKRFAGKSTMNVTSLVIHGLSAISVYSDVVGVRLLGLISFLMSCVMVAGAGVFSVYWFTSLAIPGWATNAVGFLAIALMGLLVCALILVLVILQSRNHSTFIPDRDWETYVVERIRIHG